MTPEHTFRQKASPVAAGPYTHNMDCFDAAVKGLTMEQQNTLVNRMIGALSVSVDPQLWQYVVDCAKSNTLRGAR